MGLMRCLEVDVDAGAEIVQSSTEEKSAASEDSSVVEPRVGMEFDSEEAARDFYREYASREGFIVRLDRCHRSEVDGRILSRRFSCNKQGFYAKARDNNRPVRKPRISIREGCEAMMVVKVNKSEKWVCTRFVKEHSHPLNVSAGPSYRTLESKDRKIQQLTREVEHHDKLCQLYHEMLLSLLKSAEEQIELLSTKLELGVSCVKQIEDEARKPSNPH